MEKYVIGVDYGTDSVRTIIVNALNGSEVCSAVFQYPRWKQQLYCDASKNQFRQHPLDYVEGLVYTIKECINQAGLSIASKIKGISVDTTGSTPIAVNAMGMPLAMLPEFETNPNAMFVLWKDHTAIAEADAINAHAKKFEINYLQYVGGIYSSEWFWAKLWHVLKTDESVRQQAASWVEHCDWIPFLLSGGNDITQMKRSVCAAGHKGLWAEAFGGFPPNDFFANLDPLLDGVVSQLHGAAYAANEAVGTISAEWAAKLGLPNDVIIGVGAFDAHMGAVGGQIEPFYLSKVMGTSTCDMMIVPYEDLKGKCIKGICGQVNGSIVPNMLGLEAGQSAFGDIYAWYKNMLAWPLENILANSTLLSKEILNQIIEETKDSIIVKLSEAAAALPNDMESVNAVDWMNGRRTPDANQTLKGAISDLSIGSNAPQIFKALVEATCLGAKAIVQRFIDEGVPVKGIIALGGVAKKSDYIMQTMANVLQMPIKVHSSEQTCALGAAMFAATAAGIYNSINDAMYAMGAGFEKEYLPQMETNNYFENKYQQYLSLGNYVENK